MPRTPPPETADELSSAAREGGAIGGARARLGALFSRIPRPLLRRGVSLVLLGGTGAILATALWLEPAVEGHGTHLQLGLNPCSFLVATGYACPMCGATTTFTLWAHGHPLQGIANQPFASLLFVGTVSTFAVSAAEAIDPRGRWERILRWLAPWEGLLATTFLGLMGLSWAYKIWLLGQWPS